MALESRTYEGRKRQRRLRSVEKLTERIRGEFNCDYEQTREMIFLENDVRWIGASKLIFILALKKVNHKWDGLMDYGFIRLFAGKAIQGQRQEIEITEANAIEALSKILPSNLSEELTEELKDAEIYREIGYEY